MQSQCPPPRVRAVDAVAGDLPFEDGSFDAAISTFSVHQWSNVERGLREMRRGTRGTIGILSCDPREVRRFWLNDYVPGVLEAEARRYTGIETIAAALGGGVEVESAPIPFDGSDGFNEACYGRPAMFLVDGARLACSAWNFVAPVEAARGIDRLRLDLASGAWDARHRGLRSQPTFEGSLRWIVARGR